MSIEKDLYILNHWSDVYRFQDFLDLSQIDIDNILDSCKKMDEFSIFNYSFKEHTINFNKNEILIYKGAMTDKYTKEKLITMILAIKTIKENCLDKIKENFEKIDIMKIFLSRKMSFDTDTTVNYIFNLKTGEVTTNYLEVEKKPIPKEDLEWNEKGESYIRQKIGGSKVVFTRSRWLENKIHEYVQQVLNCPKYWIDQKYTKYFMISRDPFGDMCYQPYSVEEKKIISDIFNENITKMLVTLIEKSEVVDDFIFLLKLGIRRNWKSGCCICLTDEIMGTSCGCGHTEIAVFRPCGHSLCADPCFEEFITIYDIRLEDKTFESGGIKFNVANKKNINLELDKKIKCPMCRTDIKSVFRAEDVKICLPKIFINKILDLIDNH
jgi:hypothetical protein